VAADLAYVALWHPEVVLVRHRDLIGFELTPTGDYRSLAQAKMARKGH